MSESKSHLFDVKLQEQAQIYKALAHPARLQILMILSKANSCIPINISNELPLGRTTVNQHLKELKNVGLIKSTLCGSKPQYCLNPLKIMEFKQLFEPFIKQLEQTKAVCCE
ncbi:MAG: helix-turn-helix transcriptional regulator [Bacteroidales bacterium]|nr:helix-turn-helix transcriptional regulator [Bacteroidales bacterium]